MWKLVKAQLVGFDKKPIGAAASSPIIMGPGASAWTMPALVGTNAGSATLLLAAGVATKALMILNEDASVSARIRFDGSDATSVLGLPVAAGKGLYFGPGGPPVPTGKISAYTASGINISLAYI